MATMTQFASLSDPRIKHIGKSKKRKGRKPDGRAYANVRRSVFKIKRNV